jgi:hypothetical protein
VSSRHHPGEKDSHKESSRKKIFIHTKVARGAEQKIKVVAQQSNPSLNSALSSIGSTATYNIVERITEKTITTCLRYGPCKW